MYQYALFKASAQLDVQQQNWPSRKHQKHRNQRDRAFAKIHQFSPATYTAVVLGHVRNLSKYV